MAKLVFVIVSDDPGDDYLPEIMDMIKDAAEPLVHAGSTVWLGRNEEAVAFIKLTGIGQENQDG